ncbi:MAG: hypothetical protein RLZZ371_1444 [Pseudomonadota bacterium]
MSAAEITALLLLCTAVSFTPGPNTALSTALAANFGLRYALRFVFAVMVGWGLLLGLCASGLGALVVSLPPLSLGVKASGMAYLIWLAWKLWDTRQLSRADANKLEVTFWHGVMLQFLNIKAWMLALTVVAGWLAGKPDLWARFAVVLPMLLAFALASNLCYALAGTLLRQWLADPEHGGRRLRWFNRGMAAMLLVTALWMSTV